MYKKYGNKFYCFSPPVMLATFLIEFGFALYVVWRYKMTVVTRIVATILMLLGLFQLTEYMICGGLGMNHTDWARLGYVSITILPALGIHLVLALTKVSMRPLLFSAYGTAAAFVAYFVLMTDAVISKECAPNYAVYETHGLAGWLFLAYYYGWLLIAVALSAYLARKKPKLAPLLRWVAIGYALFIIPTTIANLLDRATLNAIPSVMCGFAVLFALVLVWRVLPLSKAKVFRSR